MRNNSPPGIQQNSLITLISYHKKDVFGTPHVMEPDFIFSPVTCQGETQNSWDELLQCRLHGFGNLRV